MRRRREQRWRSLPVGIALGVLAACAAGADWWRYPVAEQIEQTQTDGDPLTIRVDKQHRLPKHYVPEGLVELQQDVIRTKGRHSVREELIEPLRQLNEAAREDGVDLCVISGYRSYARQAEVYAFWLRRQGGDADATDKFSARPGHSEHQLGTVVDFSTAEIQNGIGPQFNRTAAAKWLVENAGQYGFRLSYPKGKEAQTGYMHEGWHWRFWGDAKPRR